MGGHCIDVDGGGGAGAPVLVPERLWVMFEGGKEALVTRAESSPALALDQGAVEVAGTLNVWKRQACALIVLVGGPGQSRGCDALSVPPGLAAEAGQGSTAARAIRGRTCAPLEDGAVTARRHPNCHTVEGVGCGDQVQEVVAAVEHRRGISLMYGVVPARGRGTTGRAGAGGNRKR